MKEYTQEEFNDLPIVDGVRQCPTGDYSQIKCFENCSFGGYCSFGSWCSFVSCCSFGERCSFGKRCSFVSCCSFGKICSFGECCSFGKDCSVGGHILIQCHVNSCSGLGEYKRTLYVWHTEGGVYCQAGCFFGTREEFESAVTEKYDSDHKYIKAVEFLLS